MLSNFYWYFENFLLSFYCYLFSYVQDSISRTGFDKHSAFLWTNSFYKKKSFYEFMYLCNFIKYYRVTNHFTRKMFDQKALFDRSITRLWQNYVRKLCAISHALWTLIVIFWADGTNNFDSSLSRTSTFLSIKPEE